MVILTNTTTTRLESYARARGLDVGIVKSPDNSAGVWFVSRLDGEVLRYWLSLGWSVEGAKEAIERLAAGVEPVPSATGYTSSV